MLYLVNKRDFGGKLKSYRYRNNVSAATNNNRTFTTHI